MKSFLCAAAVAAVFAASTFAADVGISISIGQPGFYGRIDIGDFPRPRLIYRQPVVIHPVPVGVASEPIYLRVPPGHAKHWRKHCHEYDACGQRVYFVRDDWYSEVYVPHYRERGGHPDEPRGEGRDRGRDHDKGDRGRGGGHDKR